MNSARLYEKRKAAALEIEKMVKDFVAFGNTSQIKKLLKVPCYCYECEGRDAADADAGTGGAADAADC